MGVYKLAISVGLIGCGALSIANLVVTRRANPGEALVELLKHAAYAGPILFAVGLWGFVDGLLFAKFYSSAGEYLKVFPVQAHALLAFPPLCVGMGLLLGFPKVVFWVSKNQAKAEAWVKKLSPFQVVFGVPSIAVGGLLALLLIGVYF